MSEEWASLDAVDQADLIRRGEISSVEAIEAAIERLNRLNPQLNAVIHSYLEEALAMAAQSDLADGPLRGVPFLMKDIGGEEAGRAVHGGLGFVKRAGYRAAQDSYFVKRVKQAGLISLGRTNTPELALLPTTEPAAYGPTRNPWNLDYSAGGSSGGAAAAVASGIVPVAHASDGGGSIRGPASMCGLVGLKPTRGRCSFGPTLGERWSGFSCEFVVSRTVRDSALMLDVLGGPMPGDPYFAAPPGEPFATASDQVPGRLRIGMMTEAPRDIAVHPQMAAAIERLGQRLESLGHQVERAYPSALEDPATVGHYVTVVGTNVARALESWGEKVGVRVAEEDVEPLTWELGRRGAEVSAPRLLATLEFVHSFGRRLAEWWEGGFDLLLTPTQALPPVSLGTLGSTPAEPLNGFLLSAPYGVFTLPFNLSGQPAISLPADWTNGDDPAWPAGLPLGAQLVAPYGGERILLSVAAQLEREMAWGDRRPPLFA